MNEVHLRDFKKYSMPFEEYMKVYFIGHYNPRGNHFFRLFHQGYGSEMARAQTSSVQ